jgi:hypothetical protein
LSKKDDEEEYFWFVSYVTTGNIFGNCALSSNSQHFHFNRISEKIAESLRNPSYGSPTNGVVIVFYKSLTFTEFANFQFHKD